ncbi:MAG: chorismate synthase [Bacteroidales bacterium]|nr:chorismate synthase [Bacteroidales bacterium]MBN2697284.1 chorismate synthase [Bacteroidales bacterium]
MNSFGRLFRISIFGESHGASVGVLIDGAPAGIPLSIDDFRDDLVRRGAGTKGTTPRRESDIPKIMSGVFHDTTTGAPLLILFENQDVHSGDYAGFKDTPRPGHADFTAFRKFGGYEDYRGGGHFSGRLTLGLVAAGMLAKKMIAPVNVKGSLIEAGGESDIDKAVDTALKEKDSIGGIVECRITQVPSSLGEPFFDSFESVLSHLVFAIPAIKGIEFGSGFRAAVMKGSEHNDVIISPDGATATNHAGGINGGITNGNEIIFRVAVKPASSIGKAQKTLNIKTERMEDLTVKGRHDACIAIRVPVVVEAAVSIVLADFMLQAQKVSRIINPKNRIY